MKILFPGSWDWKKSFNLLWQQEWWNTRTAVLQALFLWFRMYREIKLATMSIKDSLKDRATVELDQHKSNVHMDRLIIIIIALKGAIQEFVQSPQCAATRLQHICSSVPDAIMCKSRAAHRALIMCNMCYVPPGTKGQLSCKGWQIWNLIYLSFILLTEPLVLAEKHSHDQMWLNNGFNNKKALRWWQCRL